MVSCNLCAVGVRICGARRGFVFLRIAVECRTVRWLETGQVPPKSLKNKYVRQKGDTDGQRR